MNRKTLIIAGVVVFVLTAGLSFAAFRQLMPGNATLAGTSNKLSDLIAPLTPGAGKGKANVDPNAAKTETCPLNGAMYSKAEKDAWDTRTPIAIMIENHPAARPQSGLTNADVVYEAVAEGGITRFMALMYCGAQASDVILGPVRSARTYFIDWASGYQFPLYVHVGGANLPGPANALGQLNDYGWTGKNNLDQFSIGFPTFARNYNRVVPTDGGTLATEHTMETSSERIWQYAKDNRNISTWTGASKFKPWKFADDASADKRGSTGKISYEFWTSQKDFDVEWDYDSASNSYARVLAGESHIDNNNKQQIKSKDVVIMFTTEKGPIDEDHHMLYTTIGTGDALIFQNGQAIQAKWNKPSRTDMITFTAGGKEVNFVRGQIWISTVATGTNVTY